MDTDLGSDEKVHSYLSVLKRVGKVKKYQPVSYKDMPPNSSFCLSGKSNGIDFFTYAPGSIVGIVSVPFRHSISSSPVLSRWSTDNAP